MQNVSAHTDTFKILISRQIKNKA